MVKLYKYFVSVRFELKAIFWLCLVIIVLQDFWLKEIPELFSLGSELGNILYGLSASYVASFIFYFVVIHITRESDKRDLYPYIWRRTSRIIGDAKNQVVEISRHVKLENVAPWPDLSTIESMLENVNPKSQAPLLMGRPGNYANWIQYMNFARRRTNEDVSKLLDKVNFLDAKFIHLLAEIDACNHFGSIEFFENSPFTNTDMKAWSTMFFSYLELAKAIEDYADRHILPYTDEK